MSTCRKLWTPPPDLKVHCIFLLLAPCCFGSIWSDDPTKVFTHEYGVVSVGISPGSSPMIVSTTNGKEGGTFGAYGGNILIQRKVGSGTPTGFSPTRDVQRHDVCHAGKVAATAFIEDSSGAMHMFTGGDDGPICNWKIADGGSVHFVESSPVCYCTLPMRRPVRHLM